MSIIVTNCGPIELTVHPVSSINFGIEPGNNLFFDIGQEDQIFFEVQPTPGQVAFTVSKGGNVSTQDAIIEDYNVTVDGVGGPVGGTNICYLPNEWIGKRVRVFRNGTKYFNWTRISNGIQLSMAGDIWMGTEQNGAGYEETISIENY